MWPSAQIPDQLTYEEFGSNSSGTRPWLGQSQGQQSSRADNTNALELDLPTTFDPTNFLGLDTTGHLYVFDNFSDTQQTISQRDLSTTSASHWGLLPTATSTPSSSQFQDPRAAFAILPTRNNTTTEQWMSESLAATPDTNLQSPDYFNCKTSRATDRIEDHVPYQTQDHRVAAPRGQLEDMSYAELLYRCLLEAPQHTLPLHEIYDWVADRTDKAKGIGSGWRNSVRHNLSLNEAFVRTEQSDGTGPRHRWTLSPEALTKGIHSTTFYRGKSLQGGRQRDRPVNGKSQAAGALGGRAAHRRARRHLGGEAPQTSRAHHNAYTHVQSSSLDPAWQFGMATSSMESSRHSSPRARQELKDLSLNAFAPQTLGRKSSQGYVIRGNGDQRLDPTFAADEAQYFGHRMQASSWYGQDFTIDATPAQCAESRFHQWPPAAIHSEASPQNNDVLDSSAIDPFLLTS